MSHFSWIICCSSSLSKQGCELAFLLSRVTPLLRNMIETQSQFILRDTPIWTKEHMSIPTRVEQLILSWQFQAHWFSDYRNSSLFSRLIQVYCAWCNFRSQLESLLIFVVQPHFVELFLFQLNRNKLDFIHCGARKTSVNWFHTSACK